MGRGRETTNLLPARRAVCESQARRDRPVELPRIVALNFFLPNTHEAYHIFSSVTAGCYAVIPNCPGAEGAHIRNFLVRV